MIFFLAHATSKNCPTTEEGGQRDLGMDRREKSRRLLLVLLLLGKGGGGGSTPVGGAGDPLLRPRDRVSLFRCRESKKMGRGEGGSWCNRSHASTLKRDKRTPDPKGRLSYDVNFWGFLLKDYITTAQKENKHARFYSFGWGGAGVHVTRRCLARRSWRPGCTYIGRSRRRRDWRRR